MAYRTVQSLDADVTITLGGVDKKSKKPNPTSIEGFYLGSREVATTGKYNNGPSVIYFFQTDKGNVGVWGKTDLRKKLDAGKKGLMTLITYSGMKPTPRGDMHTYKVQQDPDVAIDVSDLEAASDDGSEGGYEEETSGQVYDDLDDASDIVVEENEYSDARSNAVALGQTSAAERKAKVQALVNRNKPK